MSLFDKLLEYSAGDVLPMHMPGHKRHAVDDILPYGVDITEIDGFDNLHNRQGILKELADRCAALRGAGCAFPLVGGSTAGILAAIYALTKQGDTVIIARGCHKAVYHACEICDLDIKYIFPETDKNGFFLSVTPESVEAALNKNPEASLVVITSPAYEGVISDIKTIGDIVHHYGAKLFVDSAHGAHLGYYDGFAPNSLSQGADVCVESLHKTLPALTQTAVLFVNDKAMYNDIENALDIFETSSPSYVLLASIDQCVRLLEEKKDELFPEYQKVLDSFDNTVRGLKNLEIYARNTELNCFDYDRSKIVISGIRAGISGSELANRLRNEYRIEVESAYGGYVICMTSVCDDESSLMRLADALIEIDSRLIRKDTDDNTAFDYPEPVVEMNLSQAVRSESVFVSLGEAKGKVSMQYIYAYPPGIPIIAPGEVFTEEVIGCINALEKSGAKCITAGSDKISSVKVCI